MPGEAQITICGNLTADPQIRQIGSSSVANFSVAQTPRVRQQDGSYEDGAATFYRVSIWREYADHVAASLHKGDRVVVYGTIAMREYEKDGETKQTWEVTAEEVAPSLRFATATVERATAGGGRGRQQPARQQRQPEPQQSWAAPGAYDDETPF